MEPDKGFADLHTSPDFQESQADGVKLGTGKLGASEELIPKRVQEHIGRRVQEETELVASFLVQLVRSDFRAFLWSLIISSIAPRPL